MRNTMRSTFLVTITAAALVTGIATASAQGLSSQGGGRHEGRSGSGQTQSMGPRHGGGGAALHRSATGSGHAMVSHDRSSGGATLHRGRTGGGHKQTAATRRHGGGAAVRHGRTGGSKQTLATRHGGTRTAVHRGSKGGSKMAATHRRTTAKTSVTTQRRTGKSVTTQRGTGTKAFGQAGAQGRVALSSQQRARIHDIVIKQNLTSRFRVTNVNFSISVGVVVPRSFRLFVIPEDIVFIIPRFRDFRFFVFDDELVIVDPVTFTIVAIIPV
jgi:hypothetical protein